MVAYACMGLVSVSYQREGLFLFKFKPKLLFLHEFCDGRGWQQNLNKSPCCILSDKIEVYIKFYCEKWYYLPYISQMKFHWFCPFWGPHTLNPVTYVKPFHMCQTLPHVSNPVMCVSTRWEQTIALYIWSSVFRGKYFDRCLSFQHFSGPFLLRCLSIDFKKSSASIFLYEKCLLPKHNFLVKNTVGKYRYIGK